MDRRSLACSRAWKLATSHQVGREGLHQVARIGLFNKPAGVIGGQLALPLERIAREVVGETRLSFLRRLTLLQCRAPPKREPRPSVPAMGAGSREPVARTGGV